MYYLRLAVLAFFERKRNLNYLLTNTILFLISPFLIITLPIVIFRLSIVILSPMTSYSSIICWPRKSVRAQFALSRVHSYCDIVYRVCTHFIVFWLAVVIVILFTNYDILENLQSQVQLYFWTPHDKWFIDVS